MKNHKITTGIKERIGDALSFMLQKPLLVFRLYTTEETSALDIRERARARSV